MKKSLFPALIVATALAVPAFADSDDPSKDLTTFSVSQGNPYLSLNDNSTYSGTLSFSGNGTMVISSNAAEETPATISGAISGNGGAIFFQLNGGGYLTISCSVTLEKGGYINYQGSTTFSNNTVKLGDLEFYQDGETICEVIFTGSNAQATVGTITVDKTDGELTASLTVEDGATLSVGAMEINDDFAITIDAGKMVLGGSASGSGSATNITIENGGQLSITGEDVSLNNATIEIILSEENESTYEGAVYAITGSGSLKDVTIVITVDEALKTLLDEGADYTFDIYDTGVTLGSNVTIDTSALNDYGITWSGGTITTGATTPEPSAFGLLFGLGTLLLVSTRRHRRKVA